MVSNPSIGYRKDFLTFGCKIVFEKTKNKQKEAGDAHCKKEFVVRDFLKLKTSRLLSIMGTLQMFNFVSYMLEHVSYETLLLNKNR